MGNDSVSNSSDVGSTILPERPSQVEVSTILRSSSTPTVCLSTTLLDNSYSK